MDDSTQHTYFDDPKRSLRDQILSQHDEFANSPIVTQLLDGIPEPAVIINETRQIVAYTSKVEKLIPAETLAGILGLRIGELLNCIHKDEKPAGCGTTKFCAHCGAAKSIKITREKIKPYVEECRITSSSDNNESAYDFEVHTTPLNFNGKNYTLFAIRDISGQKKKEVLERVFFHDVLNTSGSVHGIVSLLMNEEYSEDKTELLKALFESSEQLINEIVTQRDLRYAEDGNLGVDLIQISINDILKRSYNMYRNHVLAENKKLHVEYLKSDFFLTTDKSLILRSLGNLIKNALEASEVNGMVKIYTSEDNDSMFFHIFNDQIIPQSIQMQIFQRSFSTKNEKGRGIGTYSIKLIIEKYLNGEVSFISDKENKTVFTIKLPKNHNTDK